MATFARLAKKIKLNGAYVVKKLGVIEGTINEDLEFCYIKDNEIIKLPAFDDYEFAFSDEEYCYCDQTPQEDIIKENGNINSLTQLRTKYRRNTSLTFYVVFYDRVSKSVEYLEFDYKRLKSVMAILDDIDLLELMEKSEDDICAAFPKKYVLTTIKQIRNLASELNAGNSKYVGSVLEGMSYAYKQEHELEDEIAMRVANGETEINIDAEGKLVKSDENKKEEKTLDQLTEELNNLIGLENVKTKVDKLKKSLIWRENSKKKTDLEMEQPNLNMVFLGNPGTGKTTVAKIVSQMLYKLGYSNGKYKEVAARDLIGAFVGHTQLKVANLLKEMKGGVVFIDEAYTLTIGNPDLGSTFGLEAIGELMTTLSSKETIFIFAGYKDEMKKFILSNSGFKSRVKFYDFKDYTVDELTEMFVNKVNKTKFVLDAGVLEEVKKIIKSVIEIKDFGNGRFVDNLYDAIVEEHAFNTYDAKTSKKLKTITVKDLEKLNPEEIMYRDTYTKKIGF